MRLLELFCGEGGSSMGGYHRAGWDVTGVDNDEKRLALYPFHGIKADAIEYVLEHGHEYHAIHAGPTCTGYSRGTVAIPDRLTRYDRLIGVTREALRMVGRPYVIENVAGARRELIDPILLCGRMFGLSAIDDDGTPLVMDRHRLFECSEFLMAPPHPTHEPAQVAGAYGGARRDKREAREVRKGGYVPPNLEVLRALLGTPWMSERGCFLSIPPVYTQFIGEQLAEAVSEVAA